MYRIKKVLVKRTEYVEIKVHAELLECIRDCISKGILAALFMDPHILALFYTEGTDAADALYDAIEVYKKAPITANLEIVEAKMALVIIWLDSYADQVETISNAPANRTTREEAAANILGSNLTPQKLKSTDKGIPADPSFTVKNIGNGAAEIEVVNGGPLNRRIPFLLPSKYL